MCAGTLEHKGKALHGSYVFVQRNGDAIDIRIQPPGRGDYVFRLFAKSREEEGAYESATEYAVRARSLPEVSTGYPKAYSEFDEHAAILASPFQAEIATRTPAFFCITVPGAEDVVIVNGQKWTHLKKNGNVFDALVRVRKGPVRLCAQFPGRREFDTLLEYNGVDK